LNYSFDVIVYGSVYCDFIFTGLPGMPRLGEELYASGLHFELGGSAIVAAGLNKLGIKVGLLADLGTDPFSQMAWDMLKEIGLDRTLIRRFEIPLKQVTVALSFPKDRAFITCFQQPDKPPNIQSILNEYPSKHIHICGFKPALDSPQINQVAHQLGTTVSFDPGWDQRILKDQNLRKILQDVDIFMPNKVEMCHLTGESDLDLAASMLLDEMPNGTLIVKDGSYGAYGFASNNNVKIHTPAISVKPIDTTGAGDSFDAGFLFAFLQEKPLASCMQYGSICGSLSTTAIGGISGFPTLEEVEKWL
jgi:sugar/nucleoside kinase (ribokinase family)